jgi:hypothetical protein
MGRKKTATSAEKPTDFGLKIQGGMLEALGINMYSTLGKCLVEFLANAYDAEATKVDISIPFEDIEKARIKVRAAAKKLVEEKKADPFTVLTTPLPNSIEVLIRDNGHGMTPHDIENKFLPFNRNRRFDVRLNKETDELNRSENNKRQVMGRKGLGKLAGFGAAELVVIRTKRAGATYATEFRLDYSALKQKENVGTARIPAKYIEALPKAHHWTEVRLSRLKCDAVKVGRQALEETLTENFYGILPADFAMNINSDTIAPQPVDYEFWYPLGLKSGQLASDGIEFDVLGKIPFEIAVMFRKRNDHLPASKRGARIYCTNRLAAGPSLFDLPTGMHGFHNISYMECVVKADAFDHLGIDLINTNRSQLKEGEIVQAFLARVVEVMRLGVAAHARFRDEQAEDEVKRSATGAGLLKVIDHLPENTRKPARALLKKLAADHGADSQEFEEMAPLVIDCMNATDVLIRLIELGSDVTTIQQVADALRELAGIEKSDALKLYRGRKSGISALETLIQKGENLWGRKGIEVELHGLLKKAPWLIHPEFGKYAASDENLTKVYGRLAKALEIDKFANVEDASKPEKEKKRPDLVFIMGPAHSAGQVVVVELKSPSIPLDFDHLGQLKYYMNRVSDELHAELGKKIVVRGVLIGRRGSASSMAEGVYQLRKEEEEAGPETMWEVKDINQLVEAALKVHIEEIDALEADLPEESALKAAGGRRRETADTGPQARTALVTANAK